MSEPGCENCRYWRRIEGFDDQYEGECHRRAPLPVMGHRFDLIRAAILHVESAEELDEGHRVDAMHRMVEWPYTEADMWCGEHKTK